MENISESQVVKIWQHQLLDRTGLATEDGEPIKIIYPGRINDGPGADFRDAVIATGGKLVKGDIELHVKSSYWQAHQHHRDPLYNRVILHVVMWHDTEAATNLQNGDDIPALALHKYIRSPIGHRSDAEWSPAASGMPCSGATKYLTTDMATEFLDNAGEERFLAKAARFQTELTQMGASQSLYQGIMGALGYSRNKLPFVELARRLPLQILEAIARDKITDEECLARQQALLLGTAGLLPSQDQNRRHRDKLDDKWIDKLELRWASSHQTKAMSRNDWYLFKVRPLNSPVRRIVAMSYLILRYRGKGILEETVNMVKEIPVNRGYHILERGLLVTTSGYQAGRFDFGSGSRITSPILLGSRRAADIIVNVLLPFVSAWSQLTLQPELENKTFDLYRSYPKLAVNTVERHMRAQLGLSGHLINSAQRQQGLIHIYNTLCTQGQCNSCRLSQLKTGNHIQI